MKMKVTIQGEWKTGRVYVDGELLLGPRGMLAFPYLWGSESYECAVLALAILVQCRVPRLGWKLLEAFNRDVVAQLPQTDFKVEVDLGEWLGKQVSRGDAEGAEKETPS